MTKHKHYYCIRAYADGWKIEYKNYLNTWCLALNPVFEGNREYRVVPDENGWLPWYGGECPVDPGTVVETRVGYCVGKSRKAGDYIWGSSITAYRVIEEKADPYAELKAAAKDPTKQIKYTFSDGASDGWHDYDHEWSFQGLLSGYEIRNKLKKMKLLAYVDITGGDLLWRLEDYQMSEQWKRVPSEDKEIEVEE
jgi:hypothetical protein